MYIRPSHQPRDPGDVLEVIDENMFATLVTGAVASHLPFILDNGTLYAPMARANPQSALLAGDALVIFLGPHGYISPSWYADRGTAPTWDYVAVHCYGRIRVHEGDEKRRNIERLLGRLEGDRADGWSIGELSEPAIDALLANVVSFEIAVERMEGKFKLNQGDTPERIRAAIDQIERNGSPELARWMRRYNDL